MSQQKKRRQRRPGRFLSILILVFAVLVVFEGKLLISIFSKETLENQVSAEVSELLKDSTPETDTETTTDTALAETEETPETKQTEPPIVSEAVVPKQSVAVDDSFFSDAAFIGDSRMEGFRNQSGISEGTFLTGVGMNVGDIFSTQYINMYNEMITVYQALYNTGYKKIYIMLGTNNLGEPDFDNFKEKYRVCLGEIKKQVPSAEIYVMSVVYVEESKVTTGDYVNNKNISAVNEKILELCEENDYHYLNVNEVLSDGNQALIEGASSDGIHIYEKYCKIWLDYLRTHYISDSASSSTETEAKTNASSEENSEASSAN